MLQVLNGHEHSKGLTISMIAIGFMLPFIKSVVNITIYGNI